MLALMEEISKGLLLSLSQLSWKEMSCFSFVVIPTLFLRQHGQGLDYFNEKITVTFPTLGTTHTLVQSYWNWIWMYILM